MYRLTDGDEKRLESGRVGSLETASSLRELLFEGFESQETRHDTLVVPKQGESGACDKGHLLRRQRLAPRHATR